MSSVTQTYGANAAFIEELYERFRANPESVSASWREFFHDYEPQFAEEFAEDLEEQRAAVAGSNGAVAVAVPAAQQPVATQQPAPQPVAAQPVAAQPAPAQPVPATPPAAPPQPTRPTAVPSPHGTGVPVRGA